MVWIGGVMQFLSDAVRWASQVLLSMAGASWWPAAVVLALIVAASAVAGLASHAKQRRLQRARELAARLDDETQRLRCELRQRLWEGPKLLDDHLNGAPMMGAQEVFESDIVAAADKVLREAGGERRKAREILRRKLNEGGERRSGPADRDEVQAWRQLGALALVDGSRDALQAYQRAAELAPECAEAQMLVGVLHLRHGNLEAAQRAFERQIELASSSEVATLRYRGRTMLGDVHAARHATEDALDAYLQAKSEVEALSASEPSPQKLRDLSVTLDRIGDIHFARGESDEALASYREALALAEELARTCGEGKLDLLHDLSVSYERIGDLLDKKGDLAGAHQHFKKGLDLARMLAERDPANRIWAWDLSASYERLADVLHAQGKPEQALATYRRGLEIAERMVATGSLAEANYQRDLAVSYHKIGSLEALLGNMEAARDLLEKGRAIIAQLDRIAAHRSQWRSDLAKFDAALKAVH